MPTKTANSFIGSSLTPKGSSNAVRTHLCCLIELEIRAGTDWLQETVPCSSGTARKNRRGAEETGQVFGAPRSWFSRRAKAAADALRPQAFIR